VCVCHALTGSAHAASHRGQGEDAGWWEGIIGPGKALDPTRHFIFCANLVGSCYGTTGPGSIDRATGEIFGSAFPVVTTRDMVRAQKRLLDRLGVCRLRLVIGGSLGGMLTWQWLVDEPEMVEAAVPIAGTTQASPWVIALNEVARQAIVNDPAWQGGDYRDRGPDAGLALARMIAMVSYRSDRQFWERFGRRAVSSRGSSSPTGWGGFQVASYLRHHGRKLVRRFDARAYACLTTAMDLHDVARGHGDLDEALARIRSRVLVIAVDTDVLFHAHELRSSVDRLRRLGRNASYAEISSPCGHDAFLVELDQLNRLVGGFLADTGGRKGS